MASNVARASVLEEILAHKRTEVNAAKTAVSQTELEARLAHTGKTRGFAHAIRNRIAQKKPAIIAEIKKSSPSKGLIRKNFKPAEHAEDYANNRATCLSVLTDQKYFQGRDEYLQQVRVACQLPVIRKDFIIDPYQIAESRVLGADCILLIVAALQHSQLVDLVDYAQEISIDILVEVHNRLELEQALELKTELLGVNNRDLHTFETDIGVTLELAAHIPKDKLIITESGINSREDVETMLCNGIYGFLVGESFMSSDKPGEKLKELFFQ